MTYIESPGQPAIQFIRAGPKTAPAILFLHPVGLDLTWWDNQIEAFANDYNVIAFDMPGHGRSGELTIPPSFDLLSDVVGAVLAETAAGPAHIVGISVGGMIAQMFALKRPELVRSLTLVATLCTFPTAVRGALRERASVARTHGMARIAPLSNERWFPASFRQRRPDVLDRATTSLLARQPESHASMWEMIAGLDLENRISAITCPTRVIAGSEDVNAPVAAANQIAARIAGATVVEMPGVGHFPPFESPVAFNALLHEFLSGVDTAPPG